MLKVMTFNGPSNGKGRNVCADSISEPTFLITELRYTLGQLNAQLGDLTARQAASSPGTAPSAHQVLSAMVQSEQQYQEQYSRLAGIPLPAKVPVQDAGSPAAAFERMRIGTIAMLEQIQGDWLPELSNLVRQQVADDRQRATQIADDRKAVFESDQRPDLNEPLTQLH